MTKGRHTAGDLAGFMRDYHAATTEHPLVARYRTWLFRDASGDHVVSTGIKPLDGMASLFTILSADKYAGYASQVVRKLCEIADARGVTLDLLATPIGRGGLSKSDLVKWYKRRGFEVVRAGEPVMRRPPRCVEDRR